MKTFLSFCLLVFLSLTAFAQKSATDLFTSGNAKFKAGKYAEAVKDYDQVLKLDPDHVGTITNRGIAKDRLTDYKGAIADFTKAIALDPTYIVAYTSRGLSKYNLKDYKGALADYDKAIELSPKDAKSYNNRGMVKYTLKDYAGAIADYTKAIALKPKYAEAYYNRGAPQYNLGEHTKACNDWTKASSLGIKDASQYTQKYCATASTEKAAIAPAVKASATREKPENEKIDIGGMLENAGSKIKSWFGHEKSQPEQKAATKKGMPETKNTNQKNSDAVDKKAKTKQADKAASKKKAGN